MQTSRLAWNDVLKKEAKGLNDFSLGEVQQVGSNYIVTLKGTISKHKYFIPKYLVRGFDGHTLWFNVKEQQAETALKRDTAPLPDEDSRHRTAGSAKDPQKLLPCLAPSTAAKY